MLRLEQIHSLTLILAPLVSPCCRTSPGLLLSTTRYMLTARTLGNLYSNSLFTKKSPYTKSPHTMEQLFHQTLISIPQTNFYKGNKGGKEGVSSLLSTGTLLVPNAGTRTVSYISSSSASVFLSSVILFTIPPLRPCKSLKHINALAVHIQRTYNYTQHYT